MGAQRGSIAVDTRRQKLAAGSSRTGVERIFPSVVTKSVYTKSIDTVLLAEASKRSATFGAVVLGGTIILH